MRLVHIVKKSDDLDSISKKYDINKKIIMKFNNLTSIDISNIKKIYLPNNMEESFDVIKNLEAPIVFNATKSNLEDINDILKYYTVSDAVYKSLKVKAGDVLLLKKETTNIISHIVKPLENIESIAKIYNSSVEKVLSDNKLSTKRVFIGQRLLIY